VGFGDPDDVEYAHASDVVAWAIREIDRLGEERRSISTLHQKVESLEAENNRLREERPTQEELKAIALAAEQAAESDFITNEEGDRIRNVLTALLRRYAGTEGDGNG
jgi:FtsZ-binding cell division protein ZapB